MQKKPYKTPRISGLYDQTVTQIQTWGFTAGIFGPIGKMEVEKRAAAPFANSHAIKIEYISAGETCAWLLFTFQNDIEVSKQKIRDKWRSLRAQRLTPRSATIETPASGIIWEHKDQ